MKFEDAIVQSITQFYEGKMPESLNELSEDGLTYTPDWFDAFEEALKDGGDFSDIEEKPSKKAKKTAEVEEDTEIKGLGYAK
jgi:hypothetical protein